MGFIKTEDAKSFIQRPKEYIGSQEIAPYGWKFEEIDLDNANKVVKHLFNEYVEGGYVTYPIGFYKFVKLDNEEQVKIKESIEYLTGKDIEDLNRTKDFSLDKSLEIKEFLIETEKIDNLLGGGSYYAIEGMQTLSRRPATYKEAIKDYELLKKEGVFSGVGRLSADYIGIVMGLIPMFLTIYMVGRDKKDRIYELIDSKRLSSFKLITIRYLALLTMSLLPVLIIALKETILFLCVGIIIDVDINIFGFIKYILFWIVPTVMFVIALSSFLTKLTESAIGILVGVVVWFLNLHNISLTGHYPIWGLMIRHNTSKGGELISNNLDLIIKNRLFFVFLSIVLVLATVLVYDLKRRGKLARKNRKKSFSL
jgi:hypothetical protein